ncbi:MFS transporter [Brevibacillus agri]|uniref:MFS transporter n=1 Tax=Brevibacillus agri TaxID=51101 RepID=UPI003D23C998
MKTELIHQKSYALMTSLYVTIPLLPLFAENYGVSLAEAAATGSVFSLGFALGCLVYGALSDKYGRKQVILSGLFVLIVLSFLLGTVDSFGWLIVLRGLQGAAAASFSLVALAYAVEMFPLEKRVTAIGFISTGFLVAGIVGQVVGGWLSQLYDWRFLFDVLAVAYVITFLLIWLFLPKGERLYPDASVWEPFRQIRHVFRAKNLLLGYVIAFVLLLSFVSMYTVLGAYLSGPAYGLDAQQIVWVRAASIGGMVLSPLAGHLSKRFGVRGVLRFSLLLAVAGLALLGVGASLPVLIGMTLVYVSGIALAVPSLISLIGQLAGKLRGLAVSVYTFILFAGTSVGPILSIHWMKTASYAVTFAAQEKLHRRIWILCMATCADCPYNFGETPSKPRKRGPSMRKRFITEKVAGFELSIHLPSSYTEENKRYPVVYLQDAGKVAMDGYNYLDHLFNSKQLPELILVGIKPHDRNHDYTPWPEGALVADRPSFGGGASRYVQAVADEIKPHIDANYLTMPEPEHTAIAGCSLGGLVSAYAYFNRPETFGKSAWISASFWYEGFISYMQERALPAEKHRVYMYVGELEGVYKKTIQSGMVAQTKAAHRLLLEKGFPPEHLKFETDPLGTHDSFFFAFRFMNALKWLFGDGTDAFPRERAN